MSSGDGGFAQVPKWLLLSDVSDRAIRMYLRLDEYARANPEAFPLRSTLARELRCSHASVDRAGRELEDAGAVEIVSGADAGVGNRYRLVGRSGPVAAVDRSEQRVIRSERARAGWVTRRENRCITGDAPPCITSDAPLHHGGSTPSITDDAPPASPVMHRSRRTEVDELKETNQTAPESTSLELVPVGDAERTPSAPRERNELWDALVALLGHQPATEGERGKWGKAIKQLRRAGATAADVAERGVNYELRYAGKLTVMALVNHWGECATPPNGNHNGRQVANRVAILRGTGVMK